MSHATPSETNEPKPTSRKRPRLRRRLIVLLFAPLEYLWKFRWKKQWQRIGFVRSVWESGWLGRSIFFLLLALAAYAPFAGAWHDFADSTASEAVLARNPGIGLLDSVLFVIAWSLAAAALAGSPVWLFCFGSAYLTIASISVLFEMHRTLFHVAPLLCLWLVAAWKVRRPLARERWSALWFLIFSYWCGWIFGGPSGLRVLIWGENSDPEFVIRTQTILGWAGIVIALAWVCLASWLRRRDQAAGTLPPKAERPSPGFGIVWVCALLALGVGYALGWRKDAIQTQQALVDQVQYLGYFSMYFFTWIGGGFAAGSLRLADWWTRKAVRTLSPAPARWLFLLAMVAVLLVETCIVYGAELPWLEDILQIEKWNFDAGNLLGLNWHFWCTAVGLVWLVVGWLGKGPGKWMTRLALWWLALYLFSSGFWSLTQKMVDRYDSPDKNVFAGLTGLVFLLGLVWETGNLGKERSSDPTRVWRKLAWISVLLALTVILQSFMQHGFLAVQSQALAFGIFHLGLIRVWYAWRTKPLPKESVLSVGQQIGWFVGGIAASQPVLFWYPQGAAALLWLFPAFVVALYVFRWWRPAMVGISLRHAGALMGAGALYQCYSRALVDLPTNPWLPYESLQAAAERLTETILPPYTLAHVFWLTAMVAIGVLAGWCAQRIRMVSFSRES